MGEYSIVTHEREFYENGEWEAYSGFELVEGVWEDSIFVGEYDRVNRLYAWLSEITDLIEGSEKENYKNALYDIETAIYERAEKLSDSELLSLMIVSRDPIRERISTWRGGTIRDSAFVFSEDDEYKVMMTQEEQGDEAWYFADTENLSYVSVVRNMREDGVFAPMDQGNANAQMPLMSGTREDADRFVNVLRLVSEHRALLVDFEECKKGIYTSLDDLYATMVGLIAEDVQSVYRYLPKLDMVSSLKFDTFTYLRRSGLSV